MYFSNDEQIIDLITEYIIDVRYKQAILIDGDWGSGKTYFVQEKLVGALTEEFKNINENRSVLYISLYGMESCNQILDEIYSSSMESFLDQKFGDGKGEKIGTGINFAAKLLTTGMKYFNIDKNDLPQISDFKKIKDLVIIFDDLERCSIDINQLFGFINNLVEHNNIKVIIIGNQTEIEKPKFLKELPQKYSVVLNPRLKIESPMEKETKQDNKQIEFEDLRKNTQLLFSDDSMLYEKVKEKLIGLTIHYKINLENIFEEIVSRYINNDLAKKKLLLHKNEVIDIFKEYNHSNIRTLIFAIMAFEKIAISVSRIEFTPIGYLDNEYKKILIYTIEVSIRIKTGQKLYSWDSATSEFGFIYFNENSIWGPKFFGYQFVDTYLTTRFFNEEEANSVIISIMEEAKRTEEATAVKNALSLNKLYRWWLLEDEEITQLLECIQIELSEMLYHPRYFKDIVVILIQLKTKNFVPFNYLQCSKQFIGFMKNRVEQMNNELEISDLELLSYDQEMLDEYNKTMEPILEFIKMNSKMKDEEINNSFELDNNWGEAFREQCLNHEDEYISKKRFLFNVNPEKVIDKISSSCVKDIYLFLEGIKSVYSFSNLNDFYKDDLENLTKILINLKIDEMSNGSITKRIALEKLKEELEVYSNRIQGLR